MATLLNIEGSPLEGLIATLRCDESQLKNFISDVTQREIQPDKNIWEWLEWVEADILEEKRSFDYGNGFEYIAPPTTSEAGGGSFLYETGSGNKIAAYTIPEEEDCWVVELETGEYSWESFLFKALCGFGVMDEAVAAKCGVSYLWREQYGTPIAVKYNGQILPMVGILRHYCPAIAQSKIVVPMLNCGTSAPLLAIY